MSAEVEVLIPTCDRPAPLAATLTALCFQHFKDFAVIVSDQGERCIFDDPSVRTALGLLEKRGHEVRREVNLPRRGLAQQRQFLLDAVQSPCCLYLDDDVLLEPFVLGNMLDALMEEKIGFVGQALIGLSYRRDHRPDQQAIELWNEPVKPEQLRPWDPEWQRHRLHNAANILHVQEKLQITPERQKKYKIAWVGGCVLYDTQKLREAGGFGFWKDVPAEHAGEDVLAQLRVMARYGGCGLIPSGAYHQEVPTTVTNRQFDIPRELAL